MDSQAAGSLGELETLNEETPLIGEHGQEYVQSLLSTTDPITAITEIQQRGGLQDPRCQPLLGLLDQLGLSRADSHKHIVNAATHDLLERINKMTSDQHLQLLEMTFPFIGISALRAIPLALLERLQPVPPTFIKQLAVDRELFWELPPAVQRQAWELDRNLLQLHALPLINAYTYEVATALRGLDMDEGLPSAVGVGVGGGVPTSITNNDTVTFHRLPRRVLRSGSAALQRLVRMVGSSVPIYKGVLDVIVGMFRDVVDASAMTVTYGSSPNNANTTAVTTTTNITKKGGRLRKAGGTMVSTTATTTTQPTQQHQQNTNTPSGSTQLGNTTRESALCSLRSQLLMALHDGGESRLCAAEHCYKVARILDSCLDQGGGSLDERRLKELASFFQPYDVLGATEYAQNQHHKASVAAIHRAARPITTTGRSQRQRAAMDDDAESAGAPGAFSRAFDDPRRELGHAAMIVRDSPVYYVLLHFVMRRLEAVVENQAVPSDDKELMFVTRLLELGAEAGRMIRDRQFYFPEPSEDLTTTLYPIIADLILEAQLREVEDEDEDEDDAHLQHAASLEDLDEELGNTTSIAAVKKKNDTLPTPNPALLQVVLRQSVARSLVQCFCLERLAAGDGVTARMLLQIIAQCLDIIPQTLNEFGPFGLTLARRLAALLSASPSPLPSSPAASTQLNLSPEDDSETSLWTLAVDKVLVKLVDTEAEVHEEVLRLLLAAAPRIDLLRLANYTSMTLNNSRKSRKRFKKRALEEEREVGSPLGGQYGEAGGGGLFSGTTYTMQHHHMYAGGIGGGGGGLLSFSGLKKERGADGVKATYQQFLQVQPALTSTIAPTLFSYLDQP